MLSFEIAATLLLLTASATIASHPTKTGHAAAAHIRSDSARRRQAIILTPDGYGSIRIGTKASDIRGYTVMNLRPNNENCYVGRIKGVPELALLITNGTVKRITIEKAGKPIIKTAMGIGIGSTFDSVRRAYPSIDARPHQYLTGPAAYLTWLPRSGLDGLMFEIGTDRRVGIVHAGRMPELGWIENCG